jgi:hypothetical protein
LGEDDEEDMGEEGDYMDRQYDGVGCKSYEDEEDHDMRGRDSDEGEGRFLFSEEVNASGDKDEDEAPPEDNSSSAKKGRASASKGYTPNENLAFLAAVLKHDAFDKKPSDPCWVPIVQEVAAAIGASEPRKAAQGYDHWAAMKSAVKSGTGALSTSGVPIWKNSDSPATKDAKKEVYFEALFRYMTESKVAACKSANWWSRALVRELWFAFRRIRKTKPLNVGQNSAAKVVSATKEKKIKFDADKEARRDLIKRTA